MGVVTPRSTIWTFPGLSTQIRPWRGAMHWETYCRAGMVFVYTRIFSRRHEANKKTCFHLVALVGCTLLVLVGRLPLNKQREIYSVVSPRYLDVFCHWVHEQGLWISQECSLDYRGPVQLDIALSIEIIIGYKNWKSLV